MLAIVKVVSQRLAVQSRSGWVSHEHEHEHEHGSTDLHSGRATTGDAVLDYRKTWTDGASYDAMATIQRLKGLNLPLITVPIFIRKRVREIFCAQLAWGQRPREQTDFFRP